MSDEARLRALYRRAAQPASADHVAEAAWERLAMAEAAPDEEQRILAHAGACPACAEVLRALQQLQQGAAAFDQGAPRAAGRLIPLRREPASAKPRWGRLLATFGALAAAAGLVLVFSSKPGKRDAAEEEALRTATAAAEIAAGQPRGQQQATPAQFRWQPVAQAASYRVRLFAEDGEPLWTSPDAAGPQLAWPASIALKPGSYFWQVEALRDGAPVARSRLVPFWLGR